MKVTKASVTIFLHHGDGYLFIKRSASASINAGELNGIGGKLEPMEDYVSAAIRETQEETGYKIQAKDLKFCGIIKFEEGYPDEWITCFFKASVPDQNIPLGSKSREGELIWLHKDKVLNSDLDLVDDLHYIFPDIVSGDKQFFMTVAIDPSGQKITKNNTNKLFKKLNDP